MTPRALHLTYVAIIAILAVMFHAWVSEHDARLLAEQKVTISENNVKTLQQQIDANDSKFAQTLAALRKRTATITTPTQAITAIPDVSSLPFRPIANTPDIEVNALAYYQQQEKCQEGVIQLSQCNGDLSLEKQIVIQKDNEITALKKKPKLLHRVWTSIRNGSILITVGALLAKVL